MERSRETLEGVEGGRGASDAPAVSGVRAIAPAWVHAMLEDPTQSHLVHLLIGARIGPTPDRTWEEVRAELAELLAAYPSIDEALAA